VDGVIFSADKLSVIFMTISVTFIVVLLEMKVIDKSNSVIRQLEVEKSDKNEDMRQARGEH
jgi:hypothetical protein